ncbi:hypothetical protein GINT2_000311 [Glugoides intestinalis]
MPPKHPKTSTLTCLEALFGDIVSSNEEWSEEALRKMLVRFGRMPRTGWSRAHAVYCDKFEVRTPLVEFKKKASRALTAKSGRKCTARVFKQEAKKCLLECIQEEVEMDKAERARKVPSEKIKYLLLEAVANANSKLFGLMPV